MQQLSLLTIGVPRCLSTRSGDKDVVCSLNDMCWYLKREKERSGLLNLTRVDHPGRVCLLQRFSPARSLQRPPPPQPSEARRAPTLPSLPLPLFASLPHISIFQGFFPLIRHPSAARLPTKTQKHIKTKSKLTFQHPN